MSRYWEEIEDERKVTNKLQESNYFEEGPDLLIRNIATKVQGTQEIDDSLCQTGESSQQKLKCFVKERLLARAC